MPVFEVHLYHVVDARERDCRLLLQAECGEAAVMDAVRFFRNRQRIDEAASSEPYWGFLGCVKAYSWSPQQVGRLGDLEPTLPQPAPYFYEWKCDWGIPVLEGTWSREKHGPSADPAQGAEDLLSYNDAAGDRC